MLSGGGDMWQMVATSIVIAGAMGYAGWRVYRSFRSDAEPCCGCEGCPLKDHGCHENCSENHKNPDCCRKN